MSCRCLEPTQWRTRIACVAWYAACIENGGAVQFIWWILLLPCWVSVICSKRLNLRKIKIYSSSHKKPRWLTLWNLMCTNAGKGPLQSSNTSSIGRISGILRFFRLTPQLRLLDQREKLHGEPGMVRKWIGDFICWSCRVTKAALWSSTQFLSSNELEKIFIGTGKMFVFSERILVRQKLPPRVLRQWVAPQRRAGR